MSRALYADPLTHAEIRSLEAAADFLHHLRQAETVSQAVAIRERLGRVILQLTDVELEAGRIADALCDRKGE